MSEDLKNLPDLELAAKKKPVTKKRNRKKTEIEAEPMSFQQILVTVSALVFLALVSKSILIINEETLIAFIFVAFVYAVYTYAGSMIAASFTSRRERIESELAAYLEAQEQSMKMLSAEHAHILEVEDLLSSVVTQTQGSQMEVSMESARYASTSVLETLAARLMALTRMASAVSGNQQRAMVSAFRFAAHIYAQNLTSNQHANLVKLALEDLDDLAIGTFGGYEAN